VAFSTRGMCFSVRVDVAIPISCMMDQDRRGRQR
jgi:hypothetical protein